jgi:hypothetical protein
MARGPVIDLVDSDPDNDITSYSTKGRERRDSIIIIRTPSTGSHVQVELPKWSQKQRAVYEKGRLLGPLPGQPDFTSEDYFECERTNEIVRPRWATVGDTSEDEADVRPTKTRKRKKAARSVDEDFESIESATSSDELDVIDVDLESEGNDWVRRPSRSKKRGRIALETETIDVSGCFPFICVPARDINPEWSAVRLRRPRKPSQETQSGIP